ncbi:MAG: pyridoxal-5-phosphate-dependent protein subunit beta, partial [bacterium]|nr:pyridoxal-5-phosphate-dependent protein subunit beta [bacterium]
VKEIYDKCWELRGTRDDIMIFNQFEEFGNHLWHYDITGHAMCDVLDEIMKPGDRYAGLTSSTGSAGTIGCGDFMKEKYPSSKIAACEALQCPTLLLNGFGGHRIEGIGDKHVPWIHNVRNTDMIIAADDEDCMQILRLLNEPAGREYLSSQGIAKNLLDKLDLIGISGIGNIVSAIKLAKYYELTSKDIVLTVLTDSMELYGSRIQELREQFGEYTRSDAVRDYHKSILGQNKDNLLELSFYDKKRIHNLKYFTWIEQQGRELDELNEQWYNWEEYWGQIHSMVPEIDKRIEEFNQMTGLL